MLIYSEIGNGGVDGVMFAEELRYLDGSADVERISVRINSAGGVVVDAFAIYSAIRNAEKPVDIYIDGLCASSASFISQAGDSVSMVDYGLFMIHDPFNPSNEEPDEKEMDVLNRFKESIVTLLSARSLVTTDEISAMMQRETWLGAFEARDKGFVDKVVSTSETFVPDTTNLKELVNVYNGILNKDVKPKKPSRMKEVFSFLNLSEEATEVSALEAIKSLANRAVTAEGEVEGLKSELTETQNSLSEASEKLAKYQEAEAEVLKAKAVELINGYVNKGLIKNEEAVVDGWVNKAIEDSEAVTTMLDGLNVQKSPEFNFDKVNNGASKLINADNKDWNWSDWSKNDPEGLAKMQEGEPEAYAELKNKYLESLKK